MARYKLTIEYCGEKFIGWQKQKIGYSVQGTIENALKKFLQEDIDLIVAGRTDAGVHAESQVAHLDIKKKELMKLTSEDIDTLAIALKDTLSITSKMKNIDRSIG